MDEKQMVKAGDQFISIVIRSYDDQFLYCTILGYDQSNQMVKFIGFNKGKRNSREVKMVSISDLVFTQSVKNVDKRKVAKFYIPSDSILDDFSAGRITKEEMSILLRKHNEQTIS